MSTVSILSLFSFNISPYIPRTLDVHATVSPRWPLYLEHRSATVQRQSEAGLAVHAAAGAYRWRTGSELLSPDGPSSQPLRPSGERDVLVASTGPRAGTLTSCVNDKVDDGDFNDYMTVKLSSSCLHTIVLTTVGLSAMHYLYTQLHSVNNKDDGW